MLNNQQFPILAASVCVRRRLEVLLVQRGKDPGMGKWAFPGGKVRWGETTSQAALRELQEECSITAKLSHLIGLYDVVQPTYHFAIACYFGSEPLGNLQAASDAADARWFNINEISALPLASNIAAAVRASEKFLTL
jgi:8-oxo-dGTP diphosphatase